MDREPLPDLSFLKYNVLVRLHRLAAPRRVIQIDYKPSSPVEGAAMSITIHLSEP